MRLALASLLFAASTACANPTKESRTVVVEREVNTRLDKQLHKTLQKLLDAETARVETASNGNLLTRR